MSKQQIQKLTILYIDDSPDPWLSSYLKNYVEKNNASISKLNCSLAYEECPFDSSISPLEFLYKDQVINADIFIIDSRLFENQTELKQHKRYKGEELELLLRKVRPFTEVIVISQKAISAKQNIISKYSAGLDDDPRKCIDFYDKNLKLDDKIRSIIGIRTALNRFLRNTVWSSALRKKIQESISYIPHYDELSPSDIDRLIEAFQKIERKISVN